MNTKSHVVVLALLALCCERQTPPQPEPKVKDAKVEAARRRAIEEEKKKTATDAANAAVSKFEATAKQTPEERLEAYRILRSTLEKNEALIDGAKYARFRPEPLVKALVRLNQLKAEEERDAARSASIPERPIHDPPKYEGAFKLAGRVVTQYSDGVVIAQGKKYYAVLDATCRLVSCWMYVEPTGETRFIAGIGRDGRDVEVVRITERETMTDDKRAHRTAVAEYEDEYRSAVHEYQKAVTENRALVAELAANEKARARDNAKVLTQIDGLLLALLGAGKSNGVVAVDELPTEDTDKVGSAARTEKTTTPRPPRAAKAAASPASGKTSRRECLRECIASCGGDANCERSCAVSKCK